MTNIKAVTLGLSNERDQSRSVQIEPWGVEYILPTKGELILVAVDRERTPHFHINEWEDTTQIYCEEAEDYYVIQNGRRLEHAFDRGASEGIERDIAVLWAGWMK